MRGPVFQLRQDCPRKPALAYARHAFPHLGLVLGRPQSVYIGRRYADLPAGLIRCIEHGISSIPFSACARLHCHSIGKLCSTRRGAGHEWHGLLSNRTRKQLVRSRSIRVRCPRMRLGAWGERKWSPASLIAKLPELIHAAYSLRHIALPHLAGQVRRPPGKLAGAAAPHPIDCAPGKHALQQAGAALDPWRPRGIVHAGRHVLLPLDALLNDSIRLFALIDALLSLGLLALQPQPLGLILGLVQCRPVFRRTARGVLRIQLLLLFQSVHGLRALHAIDAVAWQKAPLNQTALGCHDGLPVLLRWRTCRASVRCLAPRSCLLYTSDA